MEKDNKTIRTRTAPSPTGYMHLGNLRTALFSYLFAKQHGGQFIVRIEDTDVKRYVEGAKEAIFNGLKWLGIKHDEGLDIGGQFGPYIQSQRLDIYKKYAQVLIEKDLAYHCFCDEKTLEEMRAGQMAKKQAAKYDRRCLQLSKEEIAQKIADGKPYVIRMKIPAGRIIEINDLVRGKVLYKSEELDDQVLIKSDGYPTYHLAVVVDDHLMEISHVTRTEEWLPSTPKHILLYEYFGWEVPEWAHFPLILNPDKTKMSKRTGDVAVEDYIKKGYLPEAMVNYLAFLGWNPGTEKEIYSMEELLKDFRLDKVHKAGAIFNLEKLDWYNAYYLRQLTEKDLMEKMQPYLPTTDNFTSKQIIKILNLEKERSKNLSQIGESIKFFFELSAYDKILLRWKEMTAEEIKKSLEISQKILSDIPSESFTLENLKFELLAEAEKMKNRGKLLWPLRVALSGQKNSPPPFEITEILGKNESLKRIEKAINLF
ncbi:MAG: Glutamate-tRNA ligase [Parcubacteria group bacterium GW2011_GWC2_42_6]|nr:MAG: Glutamate-tRNA ligase [Parcubacteria group bacterium GW2011_GWC2_42_6]